MSNSWWEKQHLDGGTGELTGVHSNSDGVNKCYFNPAIAVPIYNLWEGLFELSDFFFYFFFILLSVVSSFPTNLNSVLSECASLVFKFFYFSQGKTIILIITDQKVLTKEFLLDFI